MARRTTPATFPMGFRCQPTPEVLIVDFLDQSGEEDDDGSVINSVALTKDIAHKLSEALVYFIESENSEDDEQV